MISNKMETSRVNSVRLYGSSRIDCGYCKGERAALVKKTKDTSSKAYTLVAERLLPSLYEEFLCRGWRRSGTSMYKPDNWESCCPAITIRLPVNQFIPSKTQKKILRRMEKLLSPVQRNASKASTSSASEVLSRAQDVLKELDFFSQLELKTSEALREILPKDGNTAFPSPTFKMLPQNNKIKRQKKEASQSRSHESTQVLTLVSTICASIAGQSKGRIDRGMLSERLVTILKPKVVGEKLITDISSSAYGLCRVQEGNEDGNGIQHKRHRVLASTVSVQNLDRHAASGQIFVHVEIPNVFLEDPSSDGRPDMDEASSDKLANWWNIMPNDRPKLTTEAPYELSIKTLPAHESALDPDVHRLYWKYQNAIHEDPDPFQDPLTTGIKVHHDWGRLAPPGWVERAKNMLQNEYMDLSEVRRAHLVQAFVSFYEFLVENPFIEQDDGGLDGGFRLGTYHQQYRIANGHLIAVGVVDILPRGLSSVYLYYDPSFARDLLPLGKYAILREIEWAKQTAKVPYYYLGYYIESAPKMRYKADYQPSELLCPATYKWVDAEEAKATIQKNSPERHCCKLFQAPDGNDNDDEDGLSMEACLNRIRMDLDGQHAPVTFNMLTHAGQNLVRPFLTEFVKEAGAHISTRCIVDLTQPPQN